jgi:integrase/recombinase XerD
VVQFLGQVGVDWDRVGVEDVARFVSWLRAPAANVVVLDGGTGRREASTVNRHLAAVFGLYEHHARCGVGVAASLVSWRRVGRGAYKPFLHHISKGRPVPTRPIKLSAPRKVPRALSVEEVAAVIDAAHSARDRFLLALLAGTGMRVGQALGLRHSDFVSHAREIHIVPRSDNANGARAKTRQRSSIPVSPPVVRLYTDYMHAEYGEIDSDYVFVNLWSGRIGQPLTYASVHKLVGRIRSSTGISFSLHMLRHSFATEALRAGMAIDVLAKMLTQTSSVTTSSTYVHLDAADLRAELVRAGVFPPVEQ